MEIKVKNDKLIVRKRNQIIFIAFDEILYFERLNQCTFIVCEEKTIPLRKTLKEVYYLLPKKFIRTHRSFIINKSNLMELNSIDENNYEAFFGNKSKTAMVSKQYYDQIIE